MLQEAVNDGLTYRRGAGVDKIWEQENPKPEKNLKRAESHQSTARIVSQPSEHTQVSMKVHA